MRNGAWYGAGVGAGVGVTAGVVFSAATVPILGVILAPLWALEGLLFHSLSRGLDSGRHVSGLSLAPRARRRHPLAGAIWGTAGGASLGVARGAMHADDHVVVVHGAFTDGSVEQLC